MAAYEVTGLDLKNVYDGTYTEADGSDYGPLPIAKLTPGENSLILFCILAEDNPDYPKSASTVRSPDGSGQWEGMAYSWYSTYDYIIDPVPEGYTRLEREEYLYTEDANGGHYYSTLWLDWVMFTWLYHPDAAQDDSICVIDVTPQAYEEGFDTVDECLAVLEKVLAGLGAEVTEIPVDEALAGCHVEIS